LFLGGVYNQPPFGSQVQGGVDFDPTTAGTLVRAGTGAFIAAYSEGPGSGVFGSATPVNPGRVGPTDLTGSFTLGGGVSGDPGTPIAIPVIVNNAGPNAA